MDPSHRRHRIIDRRVRDLPVHRRRPPAQSQSDLPAFDLIVCDEAHRTTGTTLAGKDESAFVRIHNAAHLKGSKRLYMTATADL